MKSVKGIMYVAIIISAYVLCYLTDGYCIIRIRYYVGIRITMSFFLHKHFSIQNVVHYFSKLLNYNAHSHAMWRVYSQWQCPWSLPQFHKTM